MQSSTSSFSTWAVEELHSLLLAAADQDIPLAAADQGILPVAGQNSLRTAVAVVEVCCSSLPVVHLAGTVGRHTVVVEDLLHTGLEVDLHSSGQRHNHRSIRLAFRL